MGSCIIYKVPRETIKGRFVPYLFPKRVAANMPTWPSLATSGTIRSVMVTYGDGETLPRAAQENDLRLPT